ncbi:hypothetical protein EJB05_17623, partial [Eragrostis curvula]
MQPWGSPPSLRGSSTAFLSRTSASWKPPRRAAKSRAAQGLRHRGSRRDASPGAAPRRGSAAVEAAAPRRREPRHRRGRGRSSRIGHEEATGRIRRLGSSPRQIHGDQRRRRLSGLFRSKLGNNKTLLLVNHGPNLLSRPAQCLARLKTQTGQASRSQITPSGDDEGLRVCATPEA